MEAGDSISAVTAITRQAISPVEEVFSSKIRIKILKLLNDLGQLNVSDMAHRLRVNYQTTIRQLRILEDCKIVESRISGKTRLFRFCNSPKVTAVQNLLDTWEKEVNHE